MTIKHLAASAAFILLSFPAVTVAQQQEPQASQECLRDLQAFHQELTGTGYGIAGPRGYGVAGRPWTGVGAPGVYGGAVTTPRREMRTLSEAAYILAMNGNTEGCQMLVGEMRELYERRVAAAEGEAVPQEELADWRSRRLQAAIPVDELDGSFRVDQVIGADVRNLRDEDLGDVEDVVLSADGNIQYVLISRGGFLGLGGELVAVRWEDLRVTPDPYRDTLVLPVQEAALERAPTVDGDVEEHLASEEWRQRVEDHWTQHIDG